MRVRHTGTRGFLTIRGTRDGLVRPEFVFEIPSRDAEQLLMMCPHPLLEKVRHEIFYAGNIWHVDEFAAENTGLVLAEVELHDLGQQVTLPDWIGAEVAFDERYRNSRLADFPWRPRTIAVPAVPQPGRISSEY
ncbi:hypothetical protein CHELA1G11_21685 [Hyphomicrobiales bacterium]|nr:hypothetical protein CHELA1G11_21685 [Hyphomicrobiales bacterium]CAH1695452.1 hypothetical protein CHELA1G2_21990 [Hyphomicrobiales bacterium]